MQKNAYFLVKIVLIWGFYFDTMAVVEKMNKR